MTQQKATPLSRRQWRREKSATLAAVLRGIAALDGYGSSAMQTNDVGRLRKHLTEFNQPKRILVDKALAHAALEFERLNPKPKK